MKPQQRLAQNIKLALIKSRLTMGDMESFMRDEIGIGRNRTSQIANGRVAPNAKEIYTLAKFFKVPTEWLYAEHLEEVQVQRETRTRGALWAA